MAALETIRKRAVLLTVVIGLALLAFILGDLINSGQAFFGEGNTIVKVGDEKIDAVEFQKRYEQISAQYQNSGNTITDGALLQKNIIESMISEKLLQKEIEEVGIYVTDSELTEAMIGNNANYMMVNYARQMGFESPAQMHDFAFNPAKYGATDADVAELKAEWLQREEDMIKMLEQQKLQTILSGIFQVNELDKKYLFEENATTTKIAYAKTDYATLPEAEYAATDAELKAEYNKMKGQFKIDEEVRRGHVIAVDVAPSAEDYAAAKNMIDTVMTALKANTGVACVRNISELVIEENDVRLNDIRDTQVKDFIANAKVGDVMEPKFVSNVYTIAKLNGKSLEVDSVNVNVVTVQGDKNVQDSVLNVLNSGKAFAEVVDNVTVYGEENAWQQLLGAADDVKTKILTAGNDYVVLNSNDAAAYIVKVNSKVAPKNIYDVAVITSKVYPSTETVNGLRDGLQAFINENNTSALLEEKAVSAGYQPMAFEVGSSTPQINGLSNTREAVKWVFGAAEGAVSPIFNKDNKLVVVDLDAVYEEYLPLEDSQVKSIVAQKVISSKKGDALMAQYNGKAENIEGYAALMNTQVDTAYVTFGQPFVQGLGMGESVLVAGATTANEGELNGVVKGENAVYVYQVVSRENSGRTAGPEVDRQFSMTRGGNAIMQNADAILRKAANVENTMIKFY